MESCSFAYDGADAATVTITDAQVGHEYWFGCGNGQAFGTAVTPTLIIPVTLFSGTITASSFFAAVADNTSGDNMVGCTVFSVGETIEFPFAATWDYDTVTGDVSVTFQSELGVDYVLWIGDWGPGYNETLFVGDGTEMTVSVSVTASGATGDFTGNLTAPIPGVDTTYSDRLFLIGVAGDGLPGNPGAVSMHSAVSTGRGTARFTATVNPEGVASTVRFEYGQTVAYGEQTSDQAIGSGTTGVSVVEDVSGLTPGRTYHVRAVRTQ